MSEMSYEHRVHSSTLSIQYAFNWKWLNSSAICVYCRKLNIYINQIKLQSVLASPSFSPFDCQHMFAYRRHHRCISVSITIHYLLFLLVLLIIKWYGNVSPCHITTIFHLSIFSLFRSQLDGNKYGFGMDSEWCLTVKNGRQYMLVIDSEQCGPHLVTFLETWWNWHWNAINGASPKCQQVIAKNIKTERSRSKWMQFWIQIWNVKTIWVYCIPEGKSGKFLSWTTIIHLIGNYSELI